MSTALRKELFEWGGTLLSAKRSLLGHVSIVGSISGGTMLGRTIGGLEYGDTLASMHASLLLDGTKKRTKQEIQVLLDSMGATLSFSTSADRLNFTGRVATEKLDTLLALVVEALRDPIFPENELAIVSTHTETECALEAQDTRTQATIALTRTLYPAGHPLYDDRTDDTRVAAKKISRDDIVNYHSRAIDRSSLIISIVGDIPTDIISIVEERFVRLPSKSLPKISFDTSTSHVPTFVRTPIPDKASIDYIVGITTGITDAHPEYPALLLGINILAQWGSFTGRLMKIVREREGLTYGAYGRIVGSSIADGYISIWSTFAPQLFDQGRTSVRREIARIVKEGVETTEFKKHRDVFVARARIATLESTVLARTMHELTVRGKPLSYMKTFPERVAKVTKKEVEAALRKYLVLEQCCESAAGPVDEQSHHE